MVKEGFQLVTVQVPLDAPPLGYRNSAVLFRNHHGNRIGGLGNPDRCPVTQSHAFVHFFVRQRENTPCCHDLIVPDDYRPVMQIRIFEKDRFQQRLADSPVNDLTCGDLFGELRIPRENKDRPGLCPRKKQNRLYQIGKVFHLGLAAPGMKQLVKR